MFPSLLPPECPLVDGSRDQYASNRYRRIFMPCCRLNCCSREFLMSAIHDAISGKASPQPALASHPIGYHFCCRPLPQPTNLPPTTFTSLIGPVEQHLVYHVYQLMFMRRAAVAGRRYMSAMSNSMTPMEDALRAKGSLTPRIIQEIGHMET